MYFASDNWAGAHPRISAALTANAAGFAPAYGTSDFDKAITDEFSKKFDREVAVFFVATGTAANALAFAALARPGGVAFCHREAHIAEDECGAPEYLTAGLRLHLVDGGFSRMEPDGLAAGIARYDSVHTGRPAAVSITQTTETGTAYSLPQIEAIGDICRAHGLPLHMDGARFANALVALDTTPAEMTWKRGVDVVSFGGTKNGCWCAEALVFFDPAKAADMPFIRKRAAQLFSKSRFISAQFAAYFEDDLWLETARHANAMAARLGNHLQSAAKARLAWKPDANEVFAIMAKRTVEELAARGAVFYPWPSPHGYQGKIDPEQTLCRFVTSFATTAEEVDAFGSLIA